MTEHEDKYNLYTEKIKENPLTKYKTLISLFKLGLAAVFAGVLAGLAFVAVINLADINRKESDDLRHEVTIPMDEYPDSMGSDIAANKDQEETSGISSAETTSAAESNAAEETPDIYDYVSNVVAKISPSMTTVTAINQNEDPLFEVVQDKMDFPGIIIADNDVEYLILTDYSICDVDEIVVTFADGMKTDASLVMADKTLDMAVIAVSHEDIPLGTINAIRIVQMGNSYMLKQGELIIAMGSMYGIKSAVDFGTAVSTKEVSYESDSRHGLIYTNINGAKECAGFLFNDEGMLIGNISKKFSSNNVIAYGISDIKIRLQNMTNRKHIGYLGIIGHEISDKLIEEYDMPAGVYVSAVDSYSPAYFAGILNGDIITDISGRTISNVYNIERTMCEFEPGTQVNVTVNRLGKDGYVPIVFTITLGER